MERIICQEPVLGQEQPATFEDVGRSYLGYSDANQARAAGPIVVKMSLELLLAHYLRIGVISCSLPANWRNIMRRIVSRRSRRRVEWNTATPAADITQSTAIRWAMVCALRSDKAFATVREMSGLSSRCNPIAGIQYM
jgi:hypothetical protein